MPNFYRSILPQSGSNDVDDNHNRNVQSMVECRPMSYFCNSATFLSHVSICSIHVLCSLRSGGVALLVRTLVYDWRTFRALRHDVQLMGE